MIKERVLKAQFPWFGGKSRVAAEVWKRFGSDVGNYVEPFFGSGAVLLGRPGGAGPIETINDADGYVANFWRALKADPDAVAEHADWPVNEADLHARHLWLLGQRERITERLMGDPEYYDAKAAGWWVWGICAWIGGGWCSDMGPWVSVDGVFTKGDAGEGVSKRLPHLGSAGQGVHRQSVALREWLSDLALRLRRVRVACGDFERVLGDSVTRRGTNCAVFLDPPYSLEMRDGDCYGTDSDDVAARARAWAIEHGDDKRLRIALCGYNGEHEMPDGWTCYEWSAHGGYCHLGNGRGKANRELERIWFSPHCLKSGGVFK